MRRPSGSPPSFKSDVLRFVVGLVVVGASMFFIVPGLRYVGEAFSSSGWPHTTGHILSSTIQSSHSSSAHATSHTPVVSYSYSVAGHDYTGSTISPGRGWAAWSAYATMRRYQPGYDAQVYYSPTDPSRSLLEPGLGLVNFDWFLWGAGIFFIGLPFVLNPGGGRGATTNADGSVNSAPNSAAGCILAICVVLFVATGLTLLFLSFW